jgi:Kef-type K+ transport system membrane component KefB
MFADQSIIHSLFLIFTGAAVIATLALWSRQALIIAYIVLGILLGPWGLAWVADTRLIGGIAEIGIIFLLFLLGLNLTPQKLVLLLKQTTVVTLVTSIIFCAAGWSIAWLFGFSMAESLLVGVASMFSSTIVGIKLLPVTVLHHRHTGEVIISVLLLQDLIAIAVMLVLKGLENAGTEMAPGVSGMAMLVLALPLLIAVAYVLNRFVLLRLFQAFDRVPEYVFLLTLAWCLGIAQLAEYIGLSLAIGAFVAGITVATSPISLVIAESLKPLRDFFLVLFFFALGASLNLDIAVQVLMPALMLAGVMLALKPVVYRFILASVAETPKLAWETGWRLGQLSEFSLLITFLALNNEAIGEHVVFMIQLATLVTFVGSSSIVVLNFPSPMAASARLRRD